MLYFALPNICENFQLNLFMHELTKVMPDSFKTKVSFFTQQGGLPYCSWNGGVNSNIGAGVYYNDLVDMQRSHSLPTRLNMSNVLLEEYDFYDNFSHIILEVFNNGSTVVELSSIPLMEYIREKFPYYRFMFSKNADLITAFTPELLDSILEEVNDVTLIGVPDKYTFNLEWLNQLKRKNMYEITVNPFCSAKCQNCDICLLKEHQNQIDYSGKSVLGLCNHSYNVLDLTNVLSIEEILEKYKGFNRFTFTCVYGRTVEEWLSFYINYFIKPSDYLKVTEYWNTWAQGQQK